MKFNIFFRATPFISILFLLLYLSFSNQSKYVKLRILIWDTPSLSLVTYLAISSGSGFLISYLITSHLGKLDQPKLPRIDNEDFYSNKDTINNIENSNNDYLYTKTLIERNINEPSPTLNASFRVIGKTSKKKNIEINEDHNVIDKNIYPEDNYYQNNTEDLNYANQSIVNNNDWNDDSYTRW